MPKVILSAWRVLAYASVSIAMLAWMERAAGRKQPSIRACVFAGLLLAAFYSGSELVPYYFWGELMPPNARIIKDAVMCIGAFVLLIVYVRSVVRDRRAQRNRQQPPE